MIQSMYEKLYYETKIFKLNIKGLFVSIKKYFNVRLQLIKILATYCLNQVKKLDLKT